MLHVYSAVPSVYFKEASDTYVSSDIEGRIAALPPEQDLLRDDTYPVTQF